MALGASPPAVTRLLAWQGLAVSGPGLLLGVGLSLVLSPRLAQGPFAFAPSGPTTITAVGLVVATVGMAVVLWSGVKASRTEPLAHLGAD